MSRDRIYRGILAVLAVGFLLGAAALLHGRLGRGDVYPPYSTLRSDPLGAKIFFDALSGIRGLTTRRNLDALDQDLGVEGDALFVLGVEPRWFASVSQIDADYLEGRMRHGGTVVIAFVSEHFNASGSEADQEQNDQRRRGSMRRRESEKKSWLTKSDVNLWTRYHIGTMRDVRPHKEGTVATVSPRWAETNAATGLASMEWRGPGRFARLGDGWDVVYQLDDHPVVVERAIGRGRLVLCAESYPFSNEAVYKHAASGFLAWTIGAGHRAVFDETHLGVVEQAGMASIMRKFHLEPMVFATLILFLLFLWKNVVQLVPEHRHGELETVVVGREGFDGMINLLRRAVPPERLLARCVEEWRSRQPAFPSEKADRIKHLLGTAQEPVGAYAAVQQIINKKD